VADLPTPEELVRKLQATPPPGPGAGPGGGGAPAPSGQGAYAAAVPARAPASAPSGGRGTAQAAPAQAPDTALAHYQTFEHVVELIRANRDVKLLVEVESGLRLVSYQPGRIEFTPADSAPADLAQRLGSALQRWTGNRWGVSVVSDGNAPTIAEIRDAAEIALREEARAHPLVQAVLARFPKAEISQIRTAAEIAASAEAEALPEVSDEWDPFEDD
jgi:DNA polymerase-3 subunit gamma/tau